MADDEDMEDASTAGHLDYKNLDVPEELSVLIPIMSKELSKTSKTLSASLTTAVTVKTEPASEMSMKHESQTSGPSVQSGSKEQVPLAEASRSKEGSRKSQELQLSGKKQSLDELGADKPQQSAKTRPARLHRQCQRRFREIIGKRELKNEELEKQEDDLRQRLNILECSMPAVMVWNIWRMTQGGCVPSLQRVLEKQFQGPASGEVYCPSTPSRHFDCRVREIEAERKQAQKRVEEARTLWAEKMSALEERGKKLEEAKTMQEEQKQRIQQLTAEAQKLKEAANVVEDDGSCETGECGVIECKKKWLEKVPSSASIKSTDLECLEKLQQLAETELTMKRQIADLERREEAYMRTLQQADEMWVKIEGDAASTMSALQEQLDNKTAANQQMADHICKLEDELEKLRAKMAICRSELEKYMSIGKIEALIGRDDDFAEVDDKYSMITREMTDKDILVRPDLADVGIKVEPITSDMISGMDGEFREDKDSQARPDLSDVGSGTHRDVADLTTGVDRADLIGVDHAQLGIHPDDFANEERRLDAARDYLARLGSLSELDGDDDYVCPPDFACNDYELSETGLTEEELAALRENRVTAKMLLEKQLSPGKKEGTAVMPVKMEGPPETVPQYMPDAVVKEEPEEEAVVKEEPEEEAFDEEVGEGDIIATAEHAGAEVKEEVEDYIPPETEVELEGEMVPEKPTEIEEAEVAVAEGVSDAVEEETPPVTEAVVAAVPAIKLEMEEGEDIPVIRDEKPPVEIASPEEKVEVIDKKMPDIAKLPEEAMEMPVEPIQKAADEVPPVVITKKSDDVIEPERPPIVKEDVDEVPVPREVEEVSPIKKEDLKVVEGVVPVQEKVEAPGEIPPPERVEAPGEIPPPERVEAPGEIPPPERVEAPREIPPPEKEKEGELPTEKVEEIEVTVMEKIPPLAEGEVEVMVEVLPEKEGQVPVLEEEELEAEVDVEKEGITEVPEEERAEVDEEIEVDALPEEEKAQVGEEVEVEALPEEEKVEVEVGALPEEEEVEVEVEVLPEEGEVEVDVDVLPEEEVPTEEGAAEVPTEVPPDAEEEVTTIPVMEIPEMPTGEEPEEPIPEISEGITPPVVQEFISCTCKQDTPPTEPPQRMEVTQTEITQIEIIKAGTTQVITQTVADVGTQTITLQKIVKRVHQPKIITITRTVDAESEALERLIRSRKPQNGSSTATMTTIGSQTGVSSIIRILQSLRTEGSHPKHDQEHELRSINYGRKFDESQQAQCDCCMCGKMVSSPKVGGRIPAEVQPPSNMGTQSALPACSKPASTRTEQGVQRETCPECNKLKRFDKALRTQDPPKQPKKPPKKPMRDQQVDACSPSCCGRQLLQKNKKKKDQSCMVKITRLRVKQTLRKDCAVDKVNGENEKEQNSDSVECICSAPAESAEPGKAKKVRCACGDPD